MRKRGREGGREGETERERERERGGGDRGRGRGRQRVLNSIVEVTHNFRNRQIFLITNAIQYDGRCNIMLICKKSQRFVPVVE